jgi:hypothetical protein
MPGKQRSGQRWHVKAQIPLPIVEESGRLQAITRDHIDERRNEFKGAMSF